MRVAVAAQRGLVIEKSQSFRRHHKAWTSERASATPGRVRRVDRAQDGAHFKSTTALVPATGLEPVRCYSLEPESSASANSATRAQWLLNYFGDLCSRQFFSFGVRR